MIGNGVIAESYISFNIKWSNPGNGGQPHWDQNAQDIELHTTDIYPDLLFTKASALATYYKYTSADKLINLLKEINAVIDSKLTKKTNETLALPAGNDKNLPAVFQKPGLPAVIDKTQDDQDSPEPEDEVTNDEPIKDEPKDSEKTPAFNGSYTVHVIADRMRFIDVQEKGGSGVTIQYRATNNITKMVGDENLDNSSKIKAVVKFGGIMGDTVEFGYSDFTIEGEGGGVQKNLLAEVLPSIELSFTVGENSVVPKGRDEEDEDWVFKALKGLKGSGAKEREFTEIKNEVNKKAEPTSVGPR
jgi:hypothetical protein